MRDAAWRCPVRRLDDLLPAVLACDVVFKAAQNLLHSRNFRGNCCFGFFFLVALFRNALMHYAVAPPNECSEKQYNKSMPPGLIAEAMEWARQPTTLAVVVPGKLFPTFIAGLQCMHCVGSC